MTVTLLTYAGMFWLTAFHQPHGRPTFLTSELLGSVVQVMMRDTARRVSLELTKSAGSIWRARDSMYFKIVTFTWRDPGHTLVSGGLARQCCWLVVTALTFRFGVWVWSTMNLIRMLNCWSNGNDSLTNRRRGNFSTHVQLTERSLATNEHLTSTFNQCFQALFFWFSFWKWAGNSALKLKKYQMNPLALTWCFTNYGLRTPSGPRGEKSFNKSHFKFGNFII